MLGITNPDQPATLPSRLNNLLLLIASHRHLAAVNQYAHLDDPWLLPVPFLVVVLIVTVGALTFRARARTFAEDL